MATAAVKVGFASSLALALSLMPPTPYNESDWIFEVVAVLVSEELLFRGRVGRASLAVWKRSLSSTGHSLAVGSGAIAFGAAHLSHLAMAPGSFVIPEVIFAMLLGTAAGYLRTTTNSTYPVVFLHAVVNYMVILM